jgi:hypothetical protein
LDSTPRSLAFLSFVPSGMTAPGPATATVWPAATFGAPQTIRAPRRRRRPCRRSGGRVGMALGLEHLADDERVEAPTP